MPGQFSKHNPYHGADGRFTDAPGGAGRDAARDASYKSKVEAEGERAPATRSELVGDLRTPDGGFTYDLSTNSKVTAGFAVSPYPQRSRVVEGVNKMSDAEVNSAVDSYIADNSDLLGQADHFMGAWNDPQTGKVYLDVSVVKRSSGEAYRLGRDNDQIAYFDLQSFESVDIDRNAKSGQ